MATSPIACAHKARFGKIQTWIFDLDNCLYPASTGLFSLIDQRMGAYIQRLLGVEAAEARRIQKHHFHTHGTTLAGLMKEHGVDLVDTSTGGNVLADIPVGPNYQVPFAAAIRAEAGLPTGAVGLIATPQQAEDVLAAGEADVVLLARAALREPSWPLRAAAELGLTWREAPYPAAYTRGKWDDVLTAA